MLYLGLLTAEGEVSTPCYRRAPLEPDGFGSVLFTEAVITWGLVVRYGIFKVARGGEALVLSAPFPVSKWVLGEDDRRDRAAVPFEEALTLSRSVEAP